MSSMEVSVIAIGALLLLVKYIGKYAVRASVELQVVVADVIQ